DRYAIDRSERIEHPRPILLRNHRAAGTLGAAYRGIGVQANDERIAEGSGLVEQADVTAVYQVKTTAGCNKSTAGTAYPSGHLERIRQSRRLGHFYLEIQALQTGDRRY